MKPYGAGTVWFARDGRIVTIDDDRDTAVRLLSPTCRFLGFRDLGDPDLEGDWIKVDPPKFPELPPKPTLVLFTQNHWGPGENYWGSVEGNTIYTVSPKCGHGATYRLPHEHVVVVPHPDNDPAAVAMIEGRA